MAAVLVITDGTTRIDLITGAFALKSWTPSVAPLKNGGEWADSALTDGRFMTSRKRANAVEQLNLTVTDASQNLIIRETQDLRRLLEAALDYWTSQRGSPVWVEARASCETNTRYAVIKGYEASRDDDPYQSPFVGSPLVAMEDWTLVIERGDWLGEVPGTSTCVEVSNIMSYWTSGAQVGIYYPTQSDDDAYVTHDAGAINTAGTTLYMGWNSPDATQMWSCGVRYRSVMPPAGSTILYAIVRFVADENDSGLANIRIYGDTDTTPPVFSTYADFMARTRTTNYSNWSISASWVAGTKYSKGGADLVDVIQEIIDSPGWAAGNDLTLIFDGRSSTDYRRPSSWDHLTDDPPELEIGWRNAETSYGHTATCLPGVFVANRQNYANITNVYHYDASGPAWSANLQTAALPFAFLPAVPAVGDIAYFGCDTSLLNSGPFGSVIYDIGTAAANVTGLAWEYWSGAAWSAIASFADCTRSPASFFGMTGIRSFCFAQPSNWATTAVNGVTGYWIRARVTAVAAGATAPTQQNRRFYAVTRPSVDIDAAEVEGDLPALLRAKIAWWYSTYYAGGTDGIIAALRSTDRGADFRMYLNAADEQNPPGITVTCGANASFATDAETPTGRKVAFSAGAGARADYTTTIDSSIAADFYGQFRAYARGAFSGDTLTLSVGWTDPLGGTSTYYFSKTITVGTGGGFYLADFGIVNIPGFPMNVQTDHSSIVINLSGIQSGVWTASVYDLILVPVDEWAVEFTSRYPEGDDESIGLIIAPDAYTYLDISSHGRNPLQALVKYSVNDDIVYGWKAIGPRPAILQANKDQQLYILTKRMFRPSLQWLASLHTSSVLAYAAHRYLSMRGDR